MCKFEIDIGQKVEVKNTDIIGEVVGRKKFEDMHEEYELKGKIRIDDKPELWHAWYDREQIEIIGEE